MPYCKLCSKYLDRHPEALSPANQNGEPLHRLLEVRQLGGLGREEHTTLPGQLLHERALLESGQTLPGAFPGKG
jgi:hypothetical protein